MRHTERSIYSFLRRHQLAIVSVTLALFSLHLALTDKKEFARGQLLKQILSYTLSPAQSAVLGAEAFVKGIFTDYVLLVGVKQENDALKRRMHSLSEDNNALLEQVRQGERLLSLLEFKSSLPYATTGAGIIGLNMERWTRTALLNKGASDGIIKDHAVISPAGVVGRTIDVQGRTSRVLLSTDLRSNIDIVVQRTRVKGVVEGNGTDGLVLKYIRQVDEVQVGDQVVTSGLAGIFPKGLVVGEVTKIEKGGDNFFKHIEVRPAVDIGRLEEVLVLKERSFHE